MGAFLLCHKDVSEECLDISLSVFEKKGFKSPSVLSMGSYTLHSYRKQLIPEDNLRENGKYILAAYGTPIYKDKSYKDTLDLILSDFESNTFDVSQMYGSYFLVLFDGKIISFVIDDMCQMPVYCTSNGSVISSSFLACAKAYGTGLTINKPACLEKLCTGMLTGYYTYFNEVYRSKFDILPDIKVISTGIKTLSAKRSCYPLEEEAKKQINTVSEQLDHIDALVRDFGADMGLSGGYDSRLLYGLLAQKYRDYLSVHTHCTRGAHENEVRIAKQLASLFEKDVNMCPTIPLADMEESEIEKTLNMNMYLFDGYSDSHYGTFSSTYGREYREKVRQGKGILFTGISGEIYRNYRKISKYVFTNSYFDTYVFYCHFKKAIRNQKLVRELRQYVKNKAFNEMGVELSTIMSPQDVRKYNATVRLPYKASCASAAFNQLSFYDAPFSHQKSVQESIMADSVVGDDALLETIMIYLVDKRFWDIPVTKVDSTHIDDKSLLTTIKRYIFARLPLSIIKYRKLRGNNINIGNEIIKKCPIIKESLGYVNLLLGDEISLDPLISNKNSYQNTIYTCKTIFEFENQISIM